jgi:F-type H+-transporting ATPase subunit gamma
MRKYFLLKKEIEAFEDVVETIGAIEKIAAANIHFLKKENENLVFYKQNLEKIISRFLLFFDYSSHPLFRANRGKEALVIMTSNKGLVGGLWHEIIEQVLLNKADYDYLICFGSRGAQYLREEGLKVDKVFSLDAEKIDLEIASKVTNYILGEFLEKPLERVDIIYPHFLNILSQEPAIIRFLPFSFSSTVLEQSETSPLGFPIFEPSKRKIFDYLIQEYIRLFFYQVLIETRLSEFTARTIFLEKASFQGEKFLKKLRMKYFKERKAEISQGQIESFSVHHLMKLLYERE